MSNWPQPTSKLEDADKQRFDMYLSELKSADLENCTRQDFYQHMGRVEGRSKWAAEAFMTKYRPLFEAAVQAWADKSDPVKRAEWLKRRSAQTPKRKNGDPDDSRGDRIGESADVPNSKKRPRSPAAEQGIRWKLIPNGSRSCLPANYPKRAAQDRPEREVAERSRQRHASSSADGSAADVRAQSAPLNADEADVVWQHRAETPAALPTSSASKSSIDDQAMEIRRLQTNIVLLENALRTNYAGEMRKLLGMVTTGTTAQQATELGRWKANQSALLLDKTSEVMVLKEDLEKARQEVEKVQKLAENRDTALREYMEDLKKEHSQALGRMTGEHADERERVRKEHMRALGRMQNEHAAALERLRTTLPLPAAMSDEGQLEEVLRAEKQRLGAAMEKEYAAKLEKERDELRNTVEAGLRTKIEAELRTTMEPELRSTIEGEHKAAFAKQAATLRDLEVNYEQLEGNYHRLEFDVGAERAEMEKYKSSLEAELRSTIEAEHKTVHESQSAALRELKIECDRLQADFDAERAEKEKCKSSLAELRSTIETESKAAFDGQAAGLRELKDKLDRLQADYMEERAEKEKLKTRVIELQDRVLLMIEEARRAA